MNEITTQEIRLLLEVIEDFYPTRKKDAAIKADLLKDILNFDIPVERIEGIAPFKQILYRKVIKGVKNVANGKAQIQIMRVKRRHS